MSAVSDSGKSITRRLKQTLSRSPASGPPPRPPPAKPALPIQARDPALSSYINAKALGRPEGLPFHELFKALFDAINGDKTGRQQLYGILLRLFFYEELPPDLIQQLVPLLQAQGGKDARVLRGLYHLLEVYVGPGSAGTPTLYDPSLVGRRPDEKVLQAVLSEAWSLLQQPDLDPIVKRATFVLAAAAARGSESIRKELVSQVQRAITAADSLAELAASGGAAAAKGRAAARPAALDWDLQHTAFLAVRLSGAATGADAISRSSFVGVGSADPVGARHALALVAEVAYRDAGYVAREMGALVAAAARQYEASGPGPAATPGQGVNLEDPWARLHLARTCAYVLHSDQSSGDVSRDGAPFWHMLHLLATRDAVDMVRFGALEAMTGAVPAAGGVTLLGVGAGAGGGKHSGSGAGKQSREDVVFQQRRGRAWRLLVAQAGLQVTIPGAPGAAAAPMKLIECLGRLLAAAVRSSANRASRFVVACNVIGSLAESCLASQSVGSSRHNTSPDCDRVLSGLAAGLGAALEADMGAAQRCACLEALLYLQAAGYPTGLTPAKMVAAAGSGGAAWAGGLQDLLLSTVLKCAKARPKLATAFLGYATAAVAISPVGIDLGKVTGLWDAAVAAGREGKEAGLAAALDTLQSPPPSSTQLRAGAGGDADVARAVREEDGWNAFVATAAWWVGEHANSLCGEYAGRKLLPQGAPSNGDLASAAAQDGVAALERESGRNPTLSRILLALQSVALTAVWQVRLAAVHALAKIAVRSGEPFRLQCYAVLAACSGGSSDPLGLQSATAPALAVLDKIYATQAVLGRLWEEHGDDVEGWPDDVVASLARRSRHITLQVEKYVCSVPKERYAVLGHRALSVLAAGKEEEVGGVAGALSFLSGQRSEELTQDVLSDRTGSEIAKSKNQEIESILSGGSEGGAIKITSGRSDVSGTLEDKNKEIETLLSGGGPSAASDPWAAPSNSFSSFNAFLQESEGTPASPSFAAQPGGSDETPRLGRAGASADFGGQAITTSWFAAPEDGQQAQQLGERQQSLARPATPPGPPGRRTATVLHMFVADYNQPDELSVFEGDQVEVLDDVDGWMLVRDPSGQQGLVPTSYLQLDQPAAAAGRGAGGPLRQTSSHTREPTLGNVFEEVAQQPAAADTRQRRGHARAGSLDYQTSKEDYLDNIFSAAPFSAPDLPTTPEDYPLPAASEDARLFNGGASSTDEGTAIAGQQLRSDGGQRAAEFGSPSFTGDSWARSESATATQPLRGESWARTSSMDAGGGSFSPATKDTATSRPQEFARQGSVSSNNPFTPSHRRTLSGASSHRRSLSGGSGDLGSLPTTPSRMEGQERTIVAGFDAEMEGELSVAPGERVKVHSDVGGWVRVVRLADHKSGLVPSWAVGGEA